MGTLNIDTRTIFCRDNIDVLRGINSGCIDLIYLDPPFNKKKVYAAPSHSKAAGAAFSDRFSEQDVQEDYLDGIRDDNAVLSEYLHGIKAIGDRSNYWYLAYMAARVLECRRILKDTGSVYLHCDPTMSHYLKILLDCVFGEDGFRNEIIWYYENASRGKRRFASAHDVILWYGKSAIDYVFNRDDVLMPYKSGMTKWRYEKKGKPPPAGKTPDDVIILPSLNAMDKKERTGYPTQKPLALLETIIKASSNEGDVVLDPFCGCATTCIAAENLGRRWIGVDVSDQTFKFAQQRLDLMPDVGELSFTTKAPQRTDGGDKI